MSLEARWTRVGGIFGLLSTAAYLLLVLATPPLAVGRLVFFSVPLIGIVFVLGLYRFLRLDGDGVVLQVGVVFAVLGGAMMNAMAVVQNASLHFLRRNVPRGDEGTAEMVEWVWSGVQSVQLGLDVSFDIFFLGGLLLLGVAMLGHPRFGRIFGGLGILLAAATLAFNLVRFPVPPEPDFGPLVGVWLLVVAIRMLASVEWAEARAGEAAAGGSRADGGLAVSGRASSTV